MELYCKISEDEYEKLGDMKEGIWLVSNVKDGRQYSLLLERSEDVPQAMLRAQILPYKKDIQKKADIFLEQLWLEFLNADSLEVLPNAKVMTETLITDICNVLPTRIKRKRKKK